MKTDEFLRLLEERLGMDAEVLTVDVSLSSVAEWDSLAVVEFIAIADEQLQIEVSVQDLVKCTTVNDLLKVLDISP